MALPTPLAILVVDDEPSLTTDSLPTCAVMGSRSAIRLRHEVTTHDVIGQAYGFGVLLHIAATTGADLDKALRAFAQVPGVSGVLTLALRTSQE
jgi:hypothetical protein